MAREIEGHTMRRFDGELHHLHNLLLQMGGLVQNQFELALQALREKELQLADKVIARDRDLNDLEVKADEEVISVIARRTPVARDLRTVMSFSKVITDLERMGDEVVRIADLTYSLYENDGPGPGTQMMRDVHGMGRMCGEMVQAALRMLDSLDVESADELRAHQLELDSEFQSSVRRLATFIMEDARNVGNSIKVVLVLKSLDRIGDHATNIVEHVYFLAKGKDIRHIPPSVHRA